MDPNSWFATPGPVPPVAADDLRQLWTFFLEAEKLSGNRNGTMGVDVDVLSSVCSPGANVTAVWYRVSQLELLRAVNRQFASYFRDGIPEDRVFEVAANFPMDKMLAGVVHHALPFDSEEFMKQIEGAPGRP